MKKIHYIVACCILLASSVAIGLAVKSCKLSESEKLEQKIEVNEKEIQNIKDKRDSLNAMPIPFSDSHSESVIESINKKYGFNIEVQDHKGDSIGGR